MQIEKYYKILGSKGKCIRGGHGNWFLPRGKTPGKWMPKIEKLVPCKDGYHICKKESIRDWLIYRCYVYEVEYKGEIVNDGNKSVVQQARLIRDVTAEILQELANDANSYIRCNIANNMKTTKETLKKLASDEDCYVRASVAKNPNTSKEILTKLVNDENDYVRSVALAATIHNQEQK